MGYRECAPPASLRDLVECLWVRDGSAVPGRVLPDGCMDLIEMDDRIVVAGPDTKAFVTGASPDALAGIRFRPGVLPRLLKVPAWQLRDSRTPLIELHPAASRQNLLDVALTLAAEDPSPETAPWSLDQLRLVTRMLAHGAVVADVARETGWSTRTLQRQCAAVYGYGPATLRRILRFRRAVRLLGDGRSMADVAAATGFADQPHLYREVRAMAGVPVAQLGSGANRSTVVPSGSSTEA